MESEKARSKQKRTANRREGATPTGLLTHRQFSHSTCNVRSVVSVRVCYTFDSPFLSRAINIHLPPTTYINNSIHIDMSVEKRKDSPSLPGGGSAMVKRARSDEQDDASKTLILSSERSGTSNAVVGTVCSLALKHRSALQQLTIVLISHTISPPD